MDKKLNKKQIEVLWEDVRKNYFNNSNLKKYDKEEAQYYSCLTLDANILDLFSIPEISPQFEYIIDMLRHSYREILKFSQYCVEPSNKKFKYTMNEYKDFFEEFKKMEKYNMLRNGLELAYNDIVELFYNEDKKQIKLSVPSINYLYTKVYDKEKPSISKIEFEKEHNDRKLFLLLAEISSIPVLLSKENYYNYINEINDSLSFIEQQDSYISTIKKDYNFKNFSYYQFKKIYFCLELLCANKLFMVNCTKNNSNSLIPTVIWMKKDIIEFINFLTGIENQIINNVISYLIYDNKIHDNQLTVYQPLLYFDPQIIINNFLTLHSIIEHKIIKLINLKSEKKSFDNKVLGQIAGNKEKEEMMLSDIFCILKSKFKHIKNNVKYASKAEFDIVLFDKQNNILILIELKDFFRSDNEFDNYNRNNELIKFQIKLEEKKQIVKDNIENFFKSTFNFNTQLNCSVESIIITKKAIFFLNNKSETKILDEYAFYQLIIKANYDLKVFLDYVQTDFIQLLDIMQNYKYYKNNFSLNDYSVETWAPGKEKRN